MNILFFLTPKADVVFIREGDTLRQVLEKMEFHRYSAVPLIAKSGRYLGTIADGDLLWHIKEHGLDLNACEKIRIEAIKTARTIRPIRIEKNMEDLLLIIADQNFVPVVDDRDNFIGIITRKSVILYLADRLRKLGGTPNETDS